MERSFFKRLAKDKTAVVERRLIRKVVSKTAEHEATHIVVAKKRGRRIVKATLIPGAGYLGLTILDAPDAAAAVAADADGHNGTSHDLAVAEHLGANITSAKEEARSILARSRNELEAVAVALEERGTLSDSEITVAMKRGPATELVLLILSNGKTESERRVNTLEEAESYVLSEPQAEINRERVENNNVVSIEEWKKDRQTKKRKKLDFSIPIDTAA